MTKMSNLPCDMVEEVLSRVPLTSLRKVGSTSRKWNTLLKDKTFAKKHLVRHAAKKKEVMAVLLMDFRVYLIRVNLHNSVETCIHREGTLSCLEEIDISRVFHCEGLLLCISKDGNRLVIWNPYLGQTKWIQPTYNDPEHWTPKYLYALGYEQMSRNHKIVCFSKLELSIYDCNSHSWRVLLDVAPRWTILTFAKGVSLKGNTYWFSSDHTNGEDVPFLYSFDFTAEKFGPRLPPPPSSSEMRFYDAFDTVTLSSVREEQLALLYQQGGSLYMEVWITTKIEPTSVSWSIKVFLEVNMEPLTRFDFQFPRSAASFFVDEEKQAVVVFDKDMDSNDYGVAYIVGVDGSLKQAPLGKCKGGVSAVFPNACSYAPSLVLLP